MAYAQSRIAGGNDNQGFILAVDQRGDPAENSECLQADCT
jgi:hypothetical protein